MITWNTNVNAPGCPGEIVNEEGRSLLIQTDWEYPAVASVFGWDMRDVQNAKPRKDFDLHAECGILKCKDCQELFYPMEVESIHPATGEILAVECPECLGECTPFVPCDHDGTDGTVDCPCGCKVGDFIQAAGEYLADNDGATANDPGYFD